MLQKIALLLTIWSCGTLAADILMATQGGTKSHKIPFWELAKGLISRGHNITFLNGFPADFNIEGLLEVTPAGLVEYIHNYTNWDLLGSRMAGEMPIKPWDGLRYAFESCDAMLRDSDTKELTKKSFDLAILDGAFPECFLGLMYDFKIPFMYINTVGFYTGSISTAGNPVSYAITPNFYSRFTDTMNLYERAINTAMQIGQTLMHMYVMRRTHLVMREHLGAQIPHPYEMSRNAANMPQALRHMLVKTFARLPYHVLWKYEGSSTDIKDITSNVKLSRWLPQQDILGHPKLRAFVTHGGLLSMFETVFHGVPVVTMPVFCDHDVNSAKAEVDGYAIKLDLQTLSANQLYKAIMKVIHNPRYRNSARYRQKLFLDQRSTALDTAIYWTEYVLRHNGAYHLQAPSRNMTWWQYYLLDVVAVYLILLCAVILALKRIDFPYEKVRSLYTLMAPFITIAKTKSKKI
ncbi:GM16511 [Drosophila sechellia]|uniref:UDP-glucuronosyltransferase n=1 Tax=Drosophila sechellia TaxID=7238 RepID=B4IHZ3_DROSE|nr:GM16511 [Drosophila sechellia]